MKIIYLGPSPSVNVGGYLEPHRRDETRDYPATIADELLKSQKQQFISEEEWKSLADELAAGEEKPRQESASVNAEQAAPGPVKAKKKGK